MRIHIVLERTTIIAALLAMMACGGSASNNGQESSPKAVDANGVVVDEDDVKAVSEALPYSSDDIREHVVLDYGNRTVRTDADESINFKHLMKKKENCFIVMSKKDYYLYVYEAQGADTVMLARYDCCFALKKGNKQKKGDMRTPDCTMKNPFKISQIADASSWSHDFGDGRGSIKSYGDYFLRLVTPGHSGIGIHGSTNNAESVPGRASEGCIRLRDKDIRELRRDFAFVGMKVIIKAENVDDLPFEVQAYKKQSLPRLRHFDPKKTLSNEQINQASPEQGRSKVKGMRSDSDMHSSSTTDMPVASKNMTIEELNSQGKNK